MKRKIIEVNEEKCAGCGLCADACHEGAIGIVEGKARLLRDDYCDGMGNCLPLCPRGAIAFVEREAADYNGSGAPKNQDCLCDSELLRKTEGNWPIQIKLTATQSPAFKGNLTIAADCTGFRGNVKFASPLLIGCPKLDGTDYSDKLAEIIAHNKITGMIVHRMSVPCCGGLAQMVEAAVGKSGKEIIIEINIMEVR
ncbi:MAG: 4Fe-4S binding protein [Oscillospiraceae bacterium]|nr:4Fe-4S binding protein [Oscillospiraceae bacterium]